MELKQTTPTKDKNEPYDTWQEDPRPLVTRKVLAFYLGETSATVYRWYRTGEIPDHLIYTAGKRTLRFRLKLCMEFFND